MVKLIQLVLLATLLVACDGKPDAAADNNAFSSIQEPQTQLTPPPQILSEKIEKNVANAENQVLSPPAPKLVKPALAASPQSSEVQPAPDFKTEAALPQQVKNANKAPPTVPAVAP